MDKINPRSIVLDPESQGEDDPKDKSSCSANFARCLPDYMAGTGEFKVDWILDSFLPKGYLVVLAGASKTGKSTFLTAMALSVCQGKDFLGFKAVKKNVLWWCFEESEQERKIALQPHFEGGSDIPENFFISHSRARIDTSDGIDKLRQFILANEIELVVIDPLYAAVETDDLSGGTAARKALQELKDLCSELKVTVILIHHFRKATKDGNSRNRIADSGQIPAVCSMDIMMDSRDFSSKREITLSCTGRGAFSNCTLVVDSSSETDFVLSSHLGSNASLNEVRKAKVLEFLGNQPRPVDAASIAEALDINIKTLKNDLTAWAKDKLIQVDASKKTFLYELPAKSEAIFIEPQAA